MDEINPMVLLFIFLYFIVLVLASTALLIIIGLFPCSPLSLVTGGPLSRGYSRIPQDR